MELAKIVLGFFLFRTCSSLDKRGYDDAVSQTYRLCNHQVTQLGFVCVCKGEDCDQLPPWDSLEVGSAHIVQTDTKGVFIRSVPVKFSNKTNHSSVATATINVTASIRQQKVMGFGGAFTDAAAMNILNLSAAAQEQLMKSYFSDQGLKYSIGRIPMASCDFSTHEYSYDDHENDFSLSNFSLAQEDVLYKIPLLQRAVEMSSVPLRLFGSPWSAPAWMKTNGEMHGRGQLKGEAGDRYHKTWAMYFVR